MTAIGEHPKIAIVDDNETVRNSLCELITRNGFKTSVIAANGLQFIEALRATNHLPDLCLIDLQMPVMNGFETITQVRKEWPDLKIIACSVNATGYQIAEVIELGANRFWQKGNAPKTLIRTIEEILPDRINST